MPVLSPDLSALLNDKVINEGEYYFSIYQEGFWSEDRYEITIDERVVF